MASGRGPADASVAKTRERRPAEARAQRENGVAPPPLPRASPRAAAAAAAAPPRSHAPLCRAARQPVLAMSDYDDLAERVAAAADMAALDAFNRCALRRRSGPRSCRAAAARLRTRRTHASACAAAAPQRGPLPRRNRPRPAGGHAPRRAVRILARAAGLQASFCGCGATRSLGLQRRAPLLTRPRSCGVARRRNRGR